MDHLRYFWQVWGKGLLLIVIGTIVVTVVVGEAVLSLERARTNDYPGQWTIRTYDD